MSEIFSMDAILAKQRVSIGKLDTQIERHEQAEAAKSGSLVFIVEIEFPAKPGEDVAMFIGDTANGLRDRVLMSRLKPVLEKVIRELGGNYSIRRRSRR